MNMRKLSINKACVLLGTLLLLAVGAVCTAVYLLTQNITAVRCVFLFSLFVLLCVICFVALIRRKLVRFSDAFCGQMDDMLSENMQLKQTACEESLFYKINYRLGRLYEVMQPEQTQEEIFLYYFQHLTQKEIGEQSGWTRSTIERHIQLALKRLKEEMEVLSHE